MKYRYNQLSNNFTRREIACKGVDCCGGVAAILPLMVRFLQSVRDKLGTPLFVTSGFRCIIHNAMEGGVDGSFHTLGGAADVISNDFTPQQVYQAAQEVIQELGFGHAILYLGKGFVHLDIRDVI